MQMKFITSVLFGTALALGPCLTAQSTGEGPSFSISGSNFDSNIPPFAINDVDSLVLKQVVAPPPTGGVHSEQQCRVDSEHQTANSVHRSHRQSQFRQSELHTATWIPCPNGMGTPRGQRRLCHRGFPVQLHQEAIDTHQSAMTTLESFPRQNLRADWGSLPSFVHIGRREKIRTSDPYHPKVVRYQAAPRAVK